jgi:hypothetical protein
MLASLLLPSTNTMFMSSCWRKANDSPSFSILKNVKLNLLEIFIFKENKRTCVYHFLSLNRLVFDLYDCERNVSNILLEVIKIQAHLF